MGKKWDRGVPSKASMGPRSIDRGTLAECANPGPYVGASMGPRSIDRGTMGFAILIEVTNKLQWGRDQLIAELSLPRCVLDFILRASMGPRSIDRGTEPHGDERGQGQAASMGPRSIDRGTGMHSARELP